MILMIIVIIIIIVIYNYLWSLDACKQLYSFCTSSDTMLYSKLSLMQFFSHIVARGATKVIGRRLHAGNL